MNSMDAPFICQHAFPHYRDTATWLDGFLEHADQVLLDGQEVGVWQAAS